MNARSATTAENEFLPRAQGRMAAQVAKKHVDEVLAAIRSKGVPAEVIAEINDDNKEVFEYNVKTVSVIPNKPSKAELEELQKKA